MRVRLSVSVSFLHRLSEKPVRHSNLPQFCLQRPTSNDPINSPKDEIKPRPTFFSNFSSRYTRIYVTTRKKWQSQLPFHADFKGGVCDLQNGRQILKIHNSNGPTFFPLTPPIRRTWTWMGGGGYGTTVWLTHLLSNDSRWSWKWLAGVFWVLPVPQMIKLLNFHFSASNSVAVSGLGIGFQVILKKWTKKKITYPTFNEWVIWIIHQLICSKLLQQEMKDKSKDECRVLVSTNVYLLEFSILIKYNFYSLLFS